MKKNQTIIIAIILITAGGLYFILAGSNANVTSNNIGTQVTDDGHAHEH